MAYTTSNLATAQAKVFGAFQAGEMRELDPRVFNLIASQGDFIANYKALRTRADRILTAYYLERAVRSVGSAYTHNHTGTHGTAGSFTPTWTPQTDVFAISLKQGDNNLYDYQEMLNHEILNAMKNLVRAHETAAGTFLFSNRSGVNGANIDGSFNAVTDVYEIPADSSTLVGTFNNRAALITEIVMDINSWGNAYDIVCDSIAYGKFVTQFNQGSGNSTNLSFQFMGKTIIHSVAMTALASGLGYTDGFWMAIPKGTVGVLPAIPKQNEMGKETMVNVYSKVRNPMVGLDYALHMYQSRADGTATGGYTQDVLEQYQIFVELAFEAAPLSTANETPLQAFAISGS